MKTLVWFAGDGRRQRGNMNSVHVSALTGSEGEEVNEAEEGICSTTTRHGPSLRAKYLQTHS